MLPLVLVTAGGCASTGPGELALGHDRWRSEVRARGLDPEEVVYPFAATPEMASWARAVTSQASGELGTLRRLQQVLFDPGQFDFTYDENINLTAEQAFAERRGNCLSFTSLFVALSRTLGYRTFLVSVDRVLDVAKEESLVIVNRHVVAGFTQAGTMHLFDFYISSEVPYVRHVIVDDVAASAMFAVNRGSMRLQHGDVAGSRSLFEQAARLAPNLAAAWINLGVARRRAGDVEGAFAAYQKALVADPGNPSALTNLAYLYTQLGRSDEARTALDAAAEGPSSPFSLIALADTEMARGDLESAHKHLRRARRGFRPVPETYEALARWARRAGRGRLAERYKVRAEELRQRAVELSN